MRIEKFGDFGNNDCERVRVELNIEKRILNKIAKEWASGILYHGTGSDSFDEDDGLTSEEQLYIVNQVQKEALKITKGELPSVNLTDIVKKYYEFE